MRRLLQFSQALRHALTADTILTGDVESLGSRVVHEVQSVQESQRGSHPERAAAVSRLVRAALEPADLRNESKHGRS